MPFPSDLPPHDEYADILDADDWNPRIDGRMADFAEDPEPAVEVHDDHEVVFDFSREVTADAVHDQAPA